MCLPALGSARMISSRARKIRRWFPGIFAALEMTPAHTPLRSLPTKVYLRAAQEGAFIFCKKYYLLTRVGIVTHPMHGKVSCGGLAFDDLDWRFKPGIGLEQWSRRPSNYTDVSDYPFGYPYSL